MIVDNQCVDIQPLTLNIIKSSEQTSMTFPERTDSNKGTLTCATSTPFFFVYCSINGYIIHYDVQESVQVNVFKHHSHSAIGCSLSAIVGANSKIFTHGSCDT